MKTYKIILATAVALCSWVNGAVVIASNDPGGAAIQAGETRAFFDQSGTALSGGYVGIGAFSTLPDFTADDGVAVESLFNQLGNAGSFNYTIAGTGVPGIFSHSASEPIIEGGQGAEFIGQNIFVVIGNGASIGASSELFVLDSGKTFGADNPSFNETIDFNGATPGTILFGRDDFSGGELETSAGNFGSSDQSYQTAQLVPEPSVALLGLLGGLGLLRRRR